MISKQELKIYNQLAKDLKKIREALERIEKKLPKSIQQEPKVEWLGHD